MPVGLDLKGFGLAAALVAVCLGAPALAQSGPSPEEETALYAEGAYQAAAAAAEVTGSADSLAFAARALLAQALTETPEGQEPDAALVARARRAAERALAINPFHDEANLQLAISLSIQSRPMGLMEAWQSGDGDRARKLAAGVLARSPRNFYALGFLAVWNIEVRRRGGAVGAQIMGASLNEAAELYADAARIAPDDVGMHWQYGRALAALDAKKYADKALAALDAAIAAHADDHVEAVMQSRAKELADLLRRDRRTAERRAAGML